MKEITGAVNTIAVPRLFCRAMGGLTGGTFLAQASEIMGRCQQFIRVGLQRGALPFGTAVKVHNRWNYYISPNLFYEYVGEGNATCKVI